MAVVKVQRIAKKGGNWNRLWQRKYNLTYRVTCNNREDGPVVIRSAMVPSSSPPVPWLPRIGQIYEVNSTERDPGSFLNEVSYDCLHAGANPELAVWDLSCTYEPYDATRFGADPIAWPIKIQFGGTRFERVVWVDAVTGEPVVNSAGDRFDPPLMADDTRSQITVVRNELISTFDWTLAENFRDTVNDAIWNGYPAKTVKIGSITTSDPQYDSNGQRFYFAVTYPFEVNRDTWVDHPVDMGYATLDASSPRKRVPIFYGGQAPNEPQKLDGDGNLLAVGATPVFLSVDKYPPVDFSVFNIDFAAALGR